MDCNIFLEIALQICQAIILDSRIIKSTQPSYSPFRPDICEIKIILDSRIILLSNLNETITNLVHLLNIDYPPLKDNHGTMIGLNFQQTFL